MSQSNIGLAIKDPDDICTVTADWAGFLAITEDYIIDCDVFSPGLTTYDCWFTNTDTTVRLGGGADGGDYIVTFRIYTQTGDQFDRSFRVRCKSK